MLIQGKKIALRTLLPSDADILFRWENDKDTWEVSGTTKPFTKKEIEDFISNQKDIYLDKQLRLMIVLQGANEATGCIDLFQFNENEKRAGVGILIDRTQRKKGQASEALELLVQYCFNTLHLNKLYCTISDNNKASTKLFQKLGFEIKKTNKDIHYLELVNRHSAGQ